jgi:hypothetical protein
MPKRPRSSARLRTAPPAARWASTAVREKVRGEMLELARPSSPCSTARDRPLGRAA